MHLGLQDPPRLLRQCGVVGLYREELDAGDYLFTAPGEEHDVVAVSDALIFVSSQKETPVVGI